MSTTIPLQPPVRPSDLPVPPSGYNHAILRPGNHTPESLLRAHAAGESLLVLKEASGIQGVLRALQTRMGPIVLTEPAYTLAHFVHADGVVGFHVWSLTFDPSKRPERRETDTYASHQAPQRHPGEPFSACPD